MRIGIALSLLIVIILIGCGTPAKITRFDPVAGPPGISTYEIDNEIYLRYKDARYQITAALFEFNSIIVMPLTITNKSGEDIEPSEYKVSLHDGRDLKEIKMLSRDHLVSAKNEMEGKGGGSNIGGPVVETTVNTIISMTQASNRAVMTKGLDYAINNYFDFRPVYANYTREGILCFLIDFKPEYPTTLMIDIKGEILMLRFMPRPADKSS
jgi:hypothetical protein